MVLLSRGQAVRGVGHMCLCEDMGSVGVLLNASAESPPQSHLNSRGLLFLL